jgi:hypothetical protein
MAESVKTDRNVGVAASLVVGKRKSANGGIPDAGGTPEEGHFVPQRC